MSDIRAVKDVINEIERLQRRVEEAKRLIEDLGENGVQVLVSGGRPVSSEMIPPMAEGLTEQVQKWEQEIDRLEKRVVLR